MQALTYHYKILQRATKILFEIEKTFIVLTILHAILSAVIPFVPIYFSAKVLDELYRASQLINDGVWQQQNAKLIWGYIALTVGLTFLLNLINSGIGRLKDLKENQFYKNEQMMVAKKTMDLNYACLEDRDVSILQAQIARNSQIGQNTWMLRNSLTEIMMHGTTLLTSGVFMSYLLGSDVVDGGYKVILVVLIVGIIGVSILCTAKKNGIFNEQINQWKPLNLWWSYYDNFFKDYHVGKDIRMYGLGQLIESKYKEVNDAYQRLDEQANRRQTKYVILSDISMFVLQMVTYVYVIYVCIKGSISIGEIAANVAYILMFVTSVNALIAMAQNLLNNNQYLEQYYKYLDLPEPCEQGQQDIMRNDTKGYEIVFKNVSFKYPSSEHYVLRGINATIKPFEKLAVVGMNGSGKTTFIKLLCRLYKPTEGEILINGVNIQEFDYKQYLQLFSTVYQDFKLFSFSLGENVATNHSYDANKVMQSLDKVGVAGKVGGMKNGLDTYLYKEFAESGHELSGGEAQKVAMARALYKDSPFIILDEPTSALDPIAEAEIYTQFDTIVANKTAVYISHRLASCKFGDRIMVFDKGEIIQEGKHEVLLQDEVGKYAEMWHAQAQYYL